MRILITVAIWGRKYAAAFADHGLASQLSTSNLPKLVSEHDVVYHIITTAKDRDWLSKRPSIDRLESKCRVIWELIESHGIDPNQIPVGIDDRKYVFLSSLQNIAFAISTAHDVLVFNYADFIWADGSLSAAVALMGNDADAVLTFCLPVERKSTTGALNSFREHDGASLSVPPRALAEIAISHLHRDAQEHFWDASNFTARPTYLFWQVAEQGMLVRAYHQTVLALRVKHGDPDFCSGITRGSLDGYYSARLASAGRVIHAADSDHVLVVSLYDAPYRTVANPRTRKQALQHVLEHMIGLGQRRFAETAIKIKSAWTNPAEWAQVEHNSLKLLRSLHAITPFNADAFERASREVKHANRTLRGRSAADWIYRNVVLRFAHSTIGVIVRRGLGGSARAMRIKIERWIYGAED